ncbi:exo-beta-N-acetylmuramidase NamZ family protein [Heyndrickxia sp. NPDC080065]|uniref:exo-beta-N-acetylmuramidase NamZ family protein n=1 Tax=Heyndrickxia sp. NPDC080065 TaxID=3390568 RepID=UPI003D0499EA
MKKWVVALLAFILSISCLSSAIAKTTEPNKKHKENTFQLGVEVLLKDNVKLLKGKRVGLITNPTGVDHSLTSIADSFYNNKNINLVALFGPEHGVRGSEEAGAYVPFYIDEKTGLPVYSLYGTTKKPTPEMLKDIDVLVFDIQDVGARFYTYIYTMAYAMEAAKENNIPFIVLDRPNPIGGTKVEGPVLESKYSSFVGMYPISLQHGMTVGELAKYFNKEFKIGADLTVVKMKGWQRDMYYDETSLQWVLPSPNMPTLDTALVYPGAALIEGTNVSEGRGTTKPFELIGAPFIDGEELAQKLNNLKLPGVMFRAAYFTPTTSKFSGQLSGGIQIHITDRNAYQSVKTGIAIVKTIHDLYPDQFEFRAEDRNGISYFDQLIGNGWVRKAINNGTSLQEIENQWKSELKAFQKKRKNYLLY